MLIKWYKKCLIFIALFTFISPINITFASTNNPDIAPKISIDLGEQLLQRYHLQQTHISSIQNAKNDLSTIEQEALDYRLYARYLDAFETLNQLSKYLIEERNSGHKNPTTMAEIDTIIQQNNQDLKEAINKIQLEFNSNFSKQEKYSTGALQLYIEHLSRLDALYSAMTEQVLNQQALELDTSTSKEYLIKHLHNRAETFSGMVQLVAKKRLELNTLINIKTDNQVLIDTLAVVNEQLIIASESFSLTTELLMKLGVDTEQYQQILVKVGGQLTSDLLDVNILGDLLNRVIYQMKSHFVEHGGEWVFKILLLIAIYYVFRSLSKLVRKILTKSLNSTKLNLSSLMKKMIISSAGRLIMILGVFIALAQLGISLAPILAGLGVAGFIIGFALQDTLSNFASGMMILIYRPYDVGDLVEVGGGVFGTVESMNLVSTTILTIDNQTLVIPNSKIWGDVIKNVTAQEIRRVDLVFGIGYSDNIDQTEALLNELVSAHPLVLEDPEPKIKLHVLNESSVDFIVRPWVKTENYWDVYWDLTREVKIRFDKEGISIPFPQRDVHFYPVTPSAE